MNFNNSIDNSELDKFSKDYFSWWDKTGEFSLLHEINQLRVEYIKSKIEKYFFDSSCDKKWNKIKLLDVGCGGGLVSIPLAELGVDVTAIDANQESIQSIKENIQKRENLRFYCSTTEDHIMEDIKYDVVLCLEVIEHVFDVPSFINSLSNLIKEEGIIIISTINRTYSSYIFAILMAEYVLKWIKKHTHQYEKFIKPSELNKYLKNNNCIIKELDGMVFNLFENKWELSRNINTNYIAVCGIV